MDSQQYIADAVRTESRDFETIATRMQSPENIRLLHSAIGLVTEAGEIQDALKKHVFYGRALDKVNLEEELGDLFWYMAIMADTLGISFEQVMEKNIRKLKSRYGEKFTEERAITRNLQTERQILES
jgi:NTP pyrophosphatase (non-canonical NTP hydrolase)